MSARRRERRRTRARRDFNPRTDFRERKGRREPKRLLSKGTIVGLMLVTAIFIVGLASAYWSPGDAPTKPPSGTIISSGVTSAQTSAVANASSERDVQLVRATFDHCGMIRRTCVVDGDTFWINGVKIRIADIDTPEVSQPQCPSEKVLGDRATNRLIELLNAGPFKMQTLGNRDEDRYGRKLRVVRRNGRSLGDQLVSEGLARTWTGRREPWC